MEKITNVQIENIVHKPLDVPEKLAKRYKHLLPTVFKKAFVGFTIVGPNNSIASALRRVLFNEILASYLHVELWDIKTNNVNIIHEMIVRRIRTIPLDQSVKTTTTFSLDVLNTSMETIDVKSSSLRPSQGPPAFNETITICTLGPGEWITLQNVRVEKEYANKEAFAMCRLANGVVSIPQDIEPVEMYKGTGQAVSISDYRINRIEFNTNGNIEPHILISQACDTLRDRLRVVKESLDLLEHNGDTHILVLENETDTIGYMIMKTINEIYPDIGAVVYTINGISQRLTITVRCHEDITTVYKTTLSALIKIFEDLKSWFATKI